MIERVELFQTKKDLLFLLALFLLLLTFSLGFEYYNYKQLTKFDSALVDAKVLKQYLKTKTTKSGKQKTYQVLQLKAEDGYKFYTIAKEDFQDVKGATLKLEIFKEKLSFYEYMRSFFAFSKIIAIYKENSYKKELSISIKEQHQDQNISQIYQALYLAQPLPKELQRVFSNLGISHLIAISGFHLGIISAVLFFLIKYPYKFLQNRYFPYRNYKLDSFLIIALSLLLYTYFLEAPPSLLRAFVMLCIGFFLYDRGIKIISMQTLLLTVLFILALFPRLFFSIGFWLSVSGVFYIFLFLIHYKNLAKIWQVTLLPIFLFIMMLPFSLTIFGNFSLQNPLSIIYTLLFTLFYPLSFVLHLLGHGGSLDSLLQRLIESGKEGVMIELNLIYLIAFILLSLGALYSKKLFALLHFAAAAFFIYAIYHVT